MIVVSNASPLINLAWIGKLDLLKGLFGKITIPQAVWEEVVINGEGQPGTEEIQSANWIQVLPVTNTELVRSFQQELDRGEAEAIALALELKADLLLMDEKIGRETAVFFNISVIGLIGVLVESKVKNLIEQVRPCLDLLTDRAGFYLKPSLIERILKDQNES